MKIHLHIDDNVELAQPTQQSYEDLKHVKQGVRSHVFKIHSNFGANIELSQPTQQSYKNLKPAKQGAS